jgi:hypothetical protein
MAKIPNPEDDDLLNKNTGEDSEEDDDIEDEDPDEDDTSDDDSNDDEGDDDDESDDDSKSGKARATLNAQNRFLKKEGYVFEKGKGWVKPTAPAAKPAKKNSASPSKDALSTTDVFVLVKANVPEEDVQEVAEYASFKKISIKEALQTNFVKSLLSDNAEQRATAAATHTGAARRASTKKNSQDLLSEASRGNLPDDPTALAEARLAKRRADKQKPTRR